MAYLTSILLCGTLFVLHSDSYVLLTANVEDVQSIAQQVANSPVMEQLKNVWRRASKTFQHSLDGPKMRADDTGDKDPVDDHEGGIAGDRDDNNRGDDNRGDDNGDNANRDNGNSELRAQRREAVEQLMSLGRNASVYLGSIKKIIDKI